MVETGTPHGETVENNDGDEIEIAGDYRTEAFLEKVRAVARKFAGREGYVNFTEGVEGNKYLNTSITVEIHNTTATESELVDHDDPVVDCDDISFDASSAEEPVIPEHPNDLNPPERFSVTIHYHMD
jgi:hypothetical protein